MFHFSNSHNTLIQWVMQTWRLCLEFMWSFFSESFLSEARVLAQSASVFNLQKCWLCPAPGKWSVPPTRLTPAIDAEVTQQGNAKLEGSTSLRCEGGLIQKTWRVIFFSSQCVLYTSSRKFYLRDLILYLCTATIYHKVEGVTTVEQP